MANYNAIIRFIFVSNRLQYCFYQSIYRQRSNERLVTPTTIWITFSWVQRLAFNQSLASYHYTYLTAVLLILFYFYKSYLSICFVLSSSLDLPSLCTQCIFVLFIFIHFFHSKPWFNSFSTAGTYCFVWVLHNNDNKINDRHWARQ